MMDVELNHLTEAERDAIFSVLRRDEDLREKEFERIRKLRNEIKRIKYKGVIKAGHDPNKTCARCREEFGWLFNKGAICTHCSHKVCDKCREYTKTGSWLCILCFKQKELEMMSGNWFYMRFRKSKRNRRTNKVVSGPEIVRASMRRNARYNGGIRERDHSEVSHSPAADVKKALQNNNASPKSLKSAGSAEDDQNSDTQSMETGMSPNKRKSDIHEVGFPKESDKQKLLDLIRPKSRSSDEEQPQVQVRRIVSHGFTDSDSSSSDEAASPNLSVRTNNIDKESGFGQMDSLRGSMRSTSGISIVSSEGRITIVTEANVSDYDIESLQSTQSISSIQDTSSIGPTNSQSVTPKLNPKFVHQEQAVIHNSNRPTKSMSLSPDIKSRNPHNEDVPDNMGYTLKVHQVSTKKRQDSRSSESEDDDKVESLNSVKFHKVSNRPRSRSPSPDPKFGQPHHDETLGQQDAWSEGLLSERSADKGVVSGHVGSLLTKGQTGGDLYTDAPRLHAELQQTATDSNNKDINTHTSLLACTLPDPPVQIQQTDIAQQIPHNDSTKALAQNNSDGTIPIRSRVNALLAKFRNDGPGGTDEELTRPLSRRGGHTPGSNDNSGGGGTQANRLCSEHGEEVIVVGSGSVTNDSSSHSDSSYSSSLHQDDDSYEDLEWDADMMALQQQLRTEDNSDLLHELRTLVAANMDIEENQGHHSPDEYDHSFDYTGAKSHGDFLDDEDETDTRNPDANYTKTGRFPRLFSADDAISDTLSVITELSEPGEEDKSSISSDRTPDIDSNSDHDITKCKVLDEADFSGSSTEVEDNEKEDLKLSDHNVQLSSRLKLGLSALSERYSQSKGFDDSGDSGNKEFDVDKDKANKEVVPGMGKCAEADVHKAQSKGRFSPHGRYEREYKDNIPLKSRRSNGVTCVPGYDTSRYLKDREWIENNPTASESENESTHSASQTSELSATESSQDDANLQEKQHDIISEREKPIVSPERRDTITELATESSKETEEDADLDFAEVFQMNMMYVNAVDESQNLAGEDLIGVQEIIEDNISIEREKMREKSISRKDQEREMERQRRKYEREREREKRKELEEQERRRELEREEFHRREEERIAKVLIFSEHGGTLTGQTQSEITKRTGNILREERGRQRLRALKQRKDFALPVDKDIQDLQNTEGILVDDSPVASVTDLKSIFDKPPSYMLPRYNDASKEEEKEEEKYLDTSDPNEMYDDIQETPTKIPTENVSRRERIFRDAISDYKKACSKDEYLDEQISDRDRNMFKRETYQNRQRHSIERDISNYEIEKQLSSKYDKEKSSEGKNIMKEDATVSLTSKRSDYMEESEEYPSLVYEHTPEQLRPKNKRGVTQRQSANGNNKIAKLEYDSKYNEDTCASAREAEDTADDVTRHEVAIEVLKSEISHALRKLSEESINYEPPRSRSRSRSRGSTVDLDDLVDSNMCEYEPDISYSHYVTEQSVSPQNSMDVKDTSDSPTKMLMTEDENIIEESPEFAVCDTQILDTEHFESDMNEEEVQEETVKAEKIRSLHFEKDLFRNLGVDNIAGQGYEDALDECDIPSTPATLVDTEAAITPGLAGESESESESEHESESESTCDGGQGQVKRDSSTCESEGESAQGTRFASVEYTEGSYGGSERTSVYTEGSYGGSERTSVYTEGSYGGSERTSVYTEGSYGGSERTSVYTEGSYGGSERTSVYTEGSIEAALSVDTESLSLCSGSPQSQSSPGSSQLSTGQSSSGDRGRNYDFSIEQSNLNRPDRDQSHCRISFDSLDVLVDDLSDTADERAHPEKVDIDFTLSLNLGPPPDPHSPKVLRARSNYSKSQASTTYIRDIETGSSSNMTNITSEHLIPTQSPQQDSVQGTDVPHSNGSLVVRAQHSHESEVDPSVISGDTVSAGMPSPQHYEHKPSDSSSTSSVPLITQQEQATYITVMGYDGRVYRKPIAKSETVPSHPKPPETMLYVHTSNLNEPCGQGIPAHIYENIGSMIVYQNCTMARAQTGTCPRSNSEPNILQKNRLLKRSVSLKSGEHNISYRSFKSHKSAANESEKNRLDSNRNPSPEKAMLAAKSLKLFDPEQSHYGETNVLKNRDKILRKSSWPDQHGNHFRSFRSSKSKKAIRRDDECHPDDISHKSMSLVSGQSLTSFNSHDFMKSDGEGFSQKKKKRSFSFKRGKLSRSLKSTKSDKLVPGQQQSSQSNRGSDAPQEVKEEKEEEDNIDDLFATHASSSRSHTPSHSTSQRSTNLLSPFSESRESIVSYYSDAGEGNYGNIAITGDIQFGLEYNYKTGIMQVRMKQCRDLAPVDTKRKRSDPYIKTYLLPDKTKSGKRKTKVKKHTLNPVFDEVLKYSITKSELETRTLWVTVWHNDTFGRNDFLGEVTMPLDYYNFDEPSPKWYKLQERNASPMSLLTYKGDLILSIKYVTADNLNKKSGGKSRQGHGELHCLVKEASNLTAVRANGTSDPFCKAYLLPDKTKKQKTQFIKNDCNPQWNHTFVWEDISLDDLPDRALELTVWDHDRFTSNDFLGAVRLNLGLGKSAGKIVDWMDAKGEEISLWQAMLDRPNCWTDGSLMLRPNMDKRK